MQIVVFYEPVISRKLPEVNWTYRFIVIIFFTTSIFAKFLQDTGTMTRIPKPKNALALWIGFCKFISISHH